MLINHSNVLYGKLIHALTDYRNGLLGRDKHQIEFASRPKKGAVAGSGEGADLSRAHQATDVPTENNRVMFMWFDPVIQSLRGPAHLQRYRLQCNRMVYWPKRRMLIPVLYYFDC